MKGHVDMAYVKEIMLEALVERLAAAALKTAATFFGSRERKAIQENLSLVVDRVMPLIRGELVWTARELGTRKA